MIFNVVYMGNYNDERLSFFYQVYIGRTKIYERKGKHKAHMGRKITTELLFIGAKKVEQLCFS